MKRVPPRMRMRWGSGAVPIPGADPSSEGAQAIGPNAPRTPSAPPARTEVFTKSRRVCFHTMIVFPCC